MPIAPSRRSYLRRGCRIGPQHAVQVEHRRLVAELGEQRIGLRAMMGLVVEEMRQDHFERIFRPEAGIVDVAHAAAREIRW